MKWNLLRITRKEVKQIPCRWQQGTPPATVDFQQPASIDSSLNSRSFPATIVPQQHRIDPLQNQLLKFSAGGVGTPCIPAEKKPCPSLFKRLSTSVLGCIPAIKQCFKIQSELLGQRRMICSLQPFHYNSKFLKSIILWLNYECLISLKFC